MRGPLFSGALGNPATLGRVCNLVREHAPVVVLSALWLAEVLASEFEVLALVEAEKRGAALRALRRARKLGHPLTIVTAASEVPLAAGSVGAVLVDSLVDIEEQPAAQGAHCRALARAQARWNRGLARRHQEPAPGSARI
jgi:hypothetical protein